MISGISSMFLPYSARFSSRLRSDSRFSSTLDADESAPKITPSTPSNTSLRDEL
jgi:hypothetical protein